MKEKKYNKNETIIWENPTKLVIDKNSRFRIDENLSELMESIKQNGVLQPISVRSEDKHVICGNRRLGASLKLGLNEVPVRYIEGIDDKQLLILNLMENMQRKDITSIEIGRQCDLMLKDSSFKLSVAELATKIGVSHSRIKNCVNIFKRLPPEFRKNVVHEVSSAERKYGDLPENIVTTILNFSTSFKKINDTEMKLLLTKTANDKITISELNLIGWMYMFGIPFRKVLKQYKLYKIMRVNLFALRTELGSVMKKEKTNNQNELVNKIVAEKYPNLLYFKNEEDEDANA
ncbi:ParB/RepB/Spo0J family partition protein [Candidatus Dojkabacteria bacterium]|jgi:ParB/RepB/Spo0J family partition protein|nr:ParB/RepB/Spo0J family partition protein [Candidatus Dojkabacteria bacterium]